MTGAVAARPRAPLRGPTRATPPAAARVPRRAAPRGVTLLELLFALTISLSVLVLVTSIFGFTAQRTSRARAKNALIRDANFAAEVLRRELRRTGIGVPSGSMLSDPTQDLDADIILAGSSQIGFLADLPRPDSNYATLSLLSTNVVNNEGNMLAVSRYLFWFNENNGNCQPKGAIGPATNCSTGTTSAFFAGLDGCKPGSNATDRSCPWGLGRLVAGEPFQVLLGDGTWLSARATTPLGFETNHHRVLMRTAAPLDPGWDVSNPLALPYRIPGEAYVTTVDRIFYLYNQTARKIERIQCYEESLQPETVTYGTGTTVSLPDLSSATCTRSVDHREFVARNVDSFTLTYLDSTGTALGPLPLATSFSKSQVARVDYAIQMSDSSYGDPINYEISGSVRVHAQ